MRSEVFSLWQKVIMANIPEKTANLLSSKELLLERHYQASYKKNWA